MKKLQHLIISNYQLILQALKGEEQDYTSLRLSKAIVLLTIPMVIEMVMESVFAIVDIFFVSRLGYNAVAAVGLTESLMTIIYAIAVGFSVGTTALVSRRIGEKDKTAASHAAAQAIVAGMVISCMIALPGALYAPELLKFMGADELLITANAGYTRVMFAGNLVIMMLFIMNAAFRSAGNAAISMRVLAIANFINLILDPIFIFGLGPIPPMGIEGAAIATTTGRGLAVAYQIYYLINGKSLLKLNFRMLKLHWEIMLKIVRLSMGGILQNLIATASWVVMVRIISAFGSAAVAGYTIGIRVIIFSLLPAWGLSNAAATLVGQNLGAGQPGRASKAGWTTGLANMAMLGILSIIYLSFPAPFIGIFISDPEVKDAGILCLQMISAGFAVYAMGMVMSQAINGAGDTYSPTLMNFISFWLVEIPLAWLLAIFLDMGPKGVYLSILIAETVLTVQGMFFFSRGRWKKKKV